MTNLNLLKRQAFALGSFLQFLQEADAETLGMVQGFLQEATGESFATAAKMMGVVFEESGRSEGENISSL